MRKRGKKLLAMMLALSMSMNVVSFQAFADVSSNGEPTVTQGTVDVETTKDNKETVGVTISTIPNADGTFKTETTTETDGFITENGSLVKLEGTEIKDSANNVIESKMEYDVQNGNYHAKGGSETNLVEKAPDVEIDIPLTGGKSNTGLGDEEGSSEVIEEKENSKTTDTVVEQGSVTVENQGVTFTEKVDKDKIDMDYVKSETNPDEKNDLVLLDPEDGGAPDKYLPGYTGEEEVIPEGVPGYEYVYVGSGNTSKYVPAIVFKEPMTDDDKLAMYGENAYIKKNSITYYYVGWLKEEDKARIKYDENGNYVTDENGFILDVDGNRIFKEERTEKGPDGETTYLHRFDNYGSSLKAEGWYEDGKWVEDLNGTGYYGIWAGPQQFVLVDSKGNIITTYCADFTTPTQDSYGYNIENLEDATYYDDESAKQIRSIALHGYWGTVGSETDEEGNEVPEIGSLEAMKKDLLEAGFTAEELASLNDGVALTATQMAIWSCSNKMSGLEFFNAHYSNWGTGNVPEEKEDEVKLLFRIYDYLMNLEPTDVKNETSEKVINADNFLEMEDLSLTVVKKAEDHENNKDENDKNDAYVTNLTFALVVEPSTENGDDLIVKVLDGQGKEIASARIAGENKEGETYQYLMPDTNGNYTFANIILTEGENNFNITMEGIQNLEEGVYLYTSQVVDSTSSQTLVGIASGQHSVDVSMNIAFDLSVDDEVVAREHVWRTEWHDSDDNGGNGGDGGNGGGSTTTIQDTQTPLAAADTMEIFDENVPLSNGAVLNIEDNQIPLAVLPMTGDVSAIWMLISLISGLGLAGVSFADRKKKRQ